MDTINYFSQDQCGRAVCICPVDKRCKFHRSGAEGERCYFYLFGYCISYAASQDKKKLFKGWVNLNG